MEKHFMFHRLSNSPYVDKEFCAEFKLNREKMKFGLIEYENDLVDDFYDDYLPLFTLYVKSSTDYKDLSVCSTQTIEKEKQSFLKKHPRFIFM